MEKKITCLGCTHHYIHYSDKIKNYSITDSGYEAITSKDHILLEEENVPWLMNLLQYYKKIIKDNKANLSEQLTFEQCNNQVNHDSIGGLAKLAKEINETAESNKKH